KSGEVCRRHSERQLIDQAMTFVVPGKAGGRAEKENQSRSDRAEKKSTHDATRIGQSVDSRGLADAETNAQAAQRVPIGIAAREIISSRKFGGARSLQPLRSPAARFPAGRNRPDS